MTYYITEDQVTDLQVLIWGGQFSKEGEPEKFNDLIRQIKAQKTHEAKTNDKK